MERNFLISERSVRPRLYEIWAVERGIPLSRASLSRFTGGEMAQRNFVIPGRRKGSPEGQSAAIQLVVVFVGQVEGAEGEVYPGGNADGNKDVCVFQVGPDHVYG